MNPTARLMVRIVAGLLLVLLVIISLAALMFNANDYRADIKQWALTNLGFELDIQDIQWNITQPTQLTLTNIKLAMPQQTTDQPIAEIEQIWLQLSSSGWFSRELVIEQVILERPTLSISDNLLLHLQGDNVEPATIEPGNAEPLPIASLQIKQFNINHLNLAVSLSQSPAVMLDDLTMNLHRWQLVQDHQLLTTTAVLDLELAINRIAINAFEVNDIFVSAQLQNQQLEIDQFSANHLKGKLVGELAMNVTPPLALKVKQFSLSDLNLEYSEGWLQNFQANSPQLTIDTESDQGVNQPVESPLFDSILIEQLALSEISFTSYDKKLPLTFNKLNLNLKNLPILSAGQWLDLSQVDQLNSLFNLNMRELYYAGTSITDLTLNSRVKDGKWAFYQVQGNSFDGHFSALFDISLQRYPDLHVSHLTARDLDIGIQPEWLAKSNDDLAEPKDRLLPLNSLVIDKLDLFNLNLLSYADELPLSVRGISLRLEQAQLIKQRHLLTIPPQWSQQASFELIVNEALYQGMKADKIRIKGKLNEDYLNPDMLQRLIPSTPVNVEGKIMDSAPEKRVIRLD
ncbi:AsmA family protein [Motilimonas cestriensis]|uniref:AsmA family protein n=1 Tax=Motilimonas cestriensis TaxID=2742685 RepID=A0ABS8W6F6_9GAMM|nr:AsmA family protein [Motilimonas cestriensis]MCE2593942.1 AsmA family protein [Motilimonas cestriensis]